MTAFTLGVFWLWARGETLKRRGVTRSSRGTPRRAARVKGPVAAPAHVNASVSKISRYTHNRDVAARLLHSARRSYGDRSLEWCTEKVIDDLERDRR